MEFWQNLFSGQGFMPRRTCGVWPDSLIALHVVSDAVIWMSYLWIPLVMLWSYQAHRKTLRLHTPLTLLLFLYVIFITACGWTHFFDALMFYNPVYRLNGIVRGLTAVASFATAVSLVRLMPLAITAPVTILTQKVALNQQHAWLRDILDSVPSGALKLCEKPSDWPEALGKDPVTVEVSDPSHLRQVRRAVQTLAEKAGFEPLRASDTISAVHEATMNALAHTGSGTVHCHASAAKIQVWIEDKGAGIPLDKLPIVTLKQGYSTAGTAGQGWYMILSLVDAAYLLTGSEGTVIVLEMNGITSHEVVPFSTAVGGDVAA